MPSLAAVFAHPDDETFAMGGTALHYAARDVVCHLFCATDGDAGQSSGMPVGSRAELGTIRRRELQEAARLLGFRDPRLGAHPDGRLKTLDADVLVGEVVDFLRQCRPRVVVTFGPEGAPNGHADHRAISRATTAAFFLAGLPTAYPEQLAAGRAPHRPGRLYYVTWEPPRPDSPDPLHGVPPTARIDVARWDDTKRAAFRIHATQRIHEAHFERVAMTPCEAFALAAGIPQPSPLVDDLFAGM